MAAWIKMKLGMKVGLDPGDFALDGNPLPPPQKGGIAPPQFSVHFYCGQMAGCIKMPLGTDVDLSPDFVLDGDPVPLPKKGAELPIFRPMFIVAKRQYGSRWYLAWRYRPQPRGLCVR